VAGSPSGRIVVSGGVDLDRYRGRAMPSREMPVPEPKVLMRRDTRGVDDPSYENPRASHFPNR